MVSVNTTSSVSKSLPQTQTDSNKKIEKDASSEFDSVLGTFLQPYAANNVSEEELFAALVAERIQTSKGAEAASQYTTELAAQRTARMKADGFVPEEDAAKAALESMIGAGTLTAEETNSIYSQAFAGAQLDSNTDALFDDRGGPNDTTIAVAALEAALLSARGIIEQFDSGTATPPERPVTETPVTNTPGNVPQPNPSDPNDIQLESIGNPEDGPEGFLYKPVSESDGRLAVLLPSVIAGRVSELQLLDADGKLLETGRYAGNANGGRDHYRFSRAGDDYPDGLKIVAKFPDGRTQTFSIADSSKRYD